MGRTASAASLLPFVAVVACTSSQAYFSEADDIEAVVASQFDGAAETLDLAVYTFTDTADGIEAAVLDAAARGVAVRVVLDRGQTSAKTGLSGQVAVAADLQQAGAELRVADGFDGGIMHHKFAVIDGRIVLTGSYNYTWDAGNQNDENLLVLVDRDLAGAYADAFSELWDRAESP